MAEELRNPRPRSSAPRVSVVVPVFNARSSLSSAVKSLLSQTLQDLEILIVDDASSDDSLSIARALACSDPRVTVLRHLRNRGQSAARNLGLDHARGTWVALLDADDLMSPTRLETLCARAEASGADLIADGVRFVGPPATGSPAGLRVRPHPGPALQALTLEDLIESDVPLNGMCSFGYLKPLMRRAFLEQWELRYDERLRFTEDLNLYVRTLFCGARFLLHPSAGYLYLQTPSSTTRGTHPRAGLIRQALENNRRMRILARNHGLEHLAALLDAHRSRWATVSWFNELKAALRERRIGDLLNLGLDCPVSPQEVLSFTRDRLRTNLVGHEPQQPHLAPLQAPRSARVTPV